MLGRTGSGGHAGCRARRERRRARGRRAWSRVRAPEGARSLTLLRMADALTLPGFVNAHSHTFQRALRGRAGGGDFWAWRELMLAEAERQTPETVRRALRRDVRRDARRRLHGRRRVPLPRARRGAGGRGGRCGGRHRARRCSWPPTRAADCRASARTRRPSTSGRSRRSAERRDPGRASPPTPSAPARATGSRRSGATPPPSGCRCTSTPASSRARSRSASPSTAAGRSSCSRAPAASAAHAPSSTPRTRTAPSSTCWRRAGARVCACPTTEANLGDGFLPAARSSTRHRALHRLRLERPHRPARGAARARGDRPAPDRQAGRRSRPSGCSASAPTRARGRWGSTPGPRSRSTSTTTRCAASTRETSSTRSSRLLRGRAQRRRREALHPERRAVEVRGLRRPARQAPGALVRLVPAAGPRRAGSICVPSCHSL